MRCGNYCFSRVSRFHFTTGKQYTREIRTEINSFRLCQNSNNFPRLKALGIKKNIAKRKRNYFPISLVTISSWSHIQFFLSNIRFIETFWLVKKLFVVLPVYIKLNVFVNPYFINIKPNLEDHEKRITISITRLLLPKLRNGIVHCCPSPTTSLFHRVKHLNKYLYRAVTCKNLHQMPPGIYNALM